MSAPVRVEYSGPEGFRVVVDEDGVHLRSPGGHGLEPVDLTRLLDLIADARDHFDSGSIPAPRPPSQEERRHMFGADREERTAKVASRAVYRALTPNQPDQPF